MPTLAKFGHRPRSRSASQVDNAVNVGSVQVDETLADVLSQAETVFGGVHPVVDSSADNRIKSEESVSAGELGGGIGDATLVLQNKDLVPREVCSPSAELFVIEAPGDGVLICPPCEPAAVAPLVHQT